MDTTPDTPKNGSLILATDRRGQRPVYVATDRSRAVFIAGKRGSGKSYTLGRLAEDVHVLGRHLVIVVDPLSIFWTTAIPANGAQPIPVRVITPGDPDAILGPNLTAAMRDHGVQLARLWLNPSDLTADAWLGLFNLRLDEPQGIALSRAIRAQEGEHYTISRLITAVQYDDLIAEATRAALVNRLQMANDLGLFADEYVRTLDVLEPGKVNIIDVSSYEPGPQSTRNLVVKLIAEQLFRTRVAARVAETLAVTGQIL